MKRQIMKRHLFRLLSLVGYGIFETTFVKSQQYWRPSALAGSCRIEMVSSKEIFNICGSVCYWSCIWSYNLANWLGAVPYKLVPSRHRTVAVRGLRIRRCGALQTARWLLSNVVVYGLSSFLTVTFLYQFAVQGFNRITMTHLVFVSASGCASLFHFTTLRDPKLAIALVNQVDKMRLEYDSDDHNGRPVRNWWEHPISILAIPYLLFACFVLVPLAGGALAFSKPEAPFVLYSYLPPEWKSSKVKWAFVGFQAFAFQQAAIPIQTSWIWWCASIFQNLSWLDSIQKGCGGDFEKYLKRYIRVQLLTGIHNDLNGKFFTPAFYAIIVAICTIFTFGALKFYNELSIFVFLMLPTFAVFCVFLLTIFTGYHAMWGIKSAKVLEELRKQACLVEGPRSEYLQKRVEALRLVQNQVGCFGHTEDGTGQALMDQVFNYLLLLLSS